ncbi:MAG: helix-turn-helix domain-containing protein [Polyangiaceae bacterium]
MARQSAGRVTRDVGRRIAELRRGRGLTQEQLSEELRVTLKYLQRCEAGKENLTIASLTKLANRLRVPISSLFAPPASREVRRGRPPRAS